MPNRPITVPSAGLLLAEVPICPTCRLAVYPMPGSILIAGIGGTGTLTSHGHVVCPCGWWVETGPGDDPMAVATAHEQEHAVDGWREFPTVGGAGMTGEGTD